MKKNISSHVNNYFFFMKIILQRKQSAHLREHVLLECWLMNVG